MADSPMTWAPTFAGTTATLGAEGAGAATTDAGITEAAITDAEIAEITDEELTALALAADPDEVVGADAVPLALYGEGGPALLPAWYMPPVMAGRARGWRVPVVALLVGSFLLIDGFGLCMTYGVLTAA